MIRHIRQAHQLTSREHRLRAQGLAGIGHTASRLGVRRTTINKWATEGRLTSEIFNDKGERLYQGEARRRLGLALEGYQTLRAPQAERVREELDALAGGR